MTVETEFEQLWVVYKGLNSSKKVEAKKSYEKAKKRWSQDNSGKDFIGFLLAQIASDKRHRSLKKKRGDFVRNWPMASTYLNQDQFLDEFEESKSDILNDINDQKEPEKCFIQNCANDVLVIHSGKPFCSEHLRKLCPNNYKDELSLAWSKLVQEIDTKDQSESWGDWYRRVYRTYLIKRGGALNKLPYRKEARQEVNEEPYFRGEITDQEIESGVEYYESLKATQENSMGVHSE